MYDYENENDVLKSHTIYLYIYLHIPLISVENHIYLITMTNKEYSIYNVQKN